MHDPDFIEKVIKLSPDKIDRDLSVFPLSILGLGFNTMMDRKSTTDFMEYRHSMNSAVGLFFTTKHFALNVQAAKNLFSNLGPKGTRINVFEKLTETFFISNIRWFIGEDVMKRSKHYKITRIAIQEKYPKSLSIERT